jgi:hypothetical protein
MGTLRLLALVQHVRDARFVFEDRRDVGDILDRPGIVKKSAKAS